MSSTKEEHSKRMRAWYVKNKEARNARRRALYKKDKAHRESVIDRTSKYRVYRDREGKVLRVIKREHKGTRVNVFSTGSVSDMLDVSVYKLTKYEKKGLLPKTIFKDDTCRLYTKNQIKLISKLVEVLSKYKDDKLVKNLQALKIFEKWND